MDTQLRQWCGTCQAATRLVIIDGRTFCAVCEPKGFDTPADADAS